MEKKLDEVIKIGANITSTTFNSEAASIGAYDQKCFIFFGNIGHVKLK